MKKNVIFAISMLVASFAVGQNRNVEEVSVSAPQFTGVENAMMHQNESPNAPIKNYLSKKVCFSAEAAACKAEGTEVVQFTVTADGNVADFKIINSVYPAIDNEIIRILKNTNGMWLPGYNNGKLVDMTHEVSMVFCLEKKNSESITKMFSEKASNYFSAGTEVLFEKKNSKKALKFYSSDINYLPKNQSLLLMRGLCRYELGDAAGANEDWNRMASLGGIDMSEYTEHIEGLKEYDELMAILQK